MPNISISLKSAFKAIGSRELLKDLFAATAPDLPVDWSLPLKKLPDSLVEACRGILGRDSDAHAELFTALQGICDVCNDRKTDAQLFGTLADAGLAALHDTPLNRSRFSAALSGYLAKEVLHGEHVHVEWDTADGGFRAYVSMNRFPSNSRQFTSSGRYRLARDPNAINFVLLWRPCDGRIRLKSGYDAKRRFSIARLFSAHLLRAYLRDEKTPCYNLNRYLEGAQLPKPDNHLISAVRMKSMEVDSLVGSLSRLAVTTHESAHTAPSQLLNAYLDFQKVPPHARQARRMEVHFSFQARKRGITATVTETDIRVPTNNLDHAEAIRRYLTRALV